MKWLLGYSRSEVHKAVRRAIADHGPAAEAYLNYPLQDPHTPSRERRLMRAALREIRRAKRREQRRSRPKQQ